MKVLLIDDETMTRAFVEHALPEGWSMDFASTLDDGLEYATTQDYDLILTDLRLPQTVNGEALTKVLEVCPHVAVMVITSLHFPAYAASLIRQGAVWVSFKPDAAVEPEIGERLLQEAMIFAVARHDAQQQQLLSQTQHAQAIVDMQRELRELRQAREQLAVIEARRAIRDAEMRALQEAVKDLEARLSAQMAERERGRWAMWTKLIAMAGAGIAAILAPWISARWGKP